MSNTDLIEIHKLIIEYVIETSQDPFYTNENGDTYKTNEYTEWLELKVIKLKGELSQH
jgi:hypothetical protein